MILRLRLIFQVIAKLQPHVVFAAHEHKSMIVQTDALLQQDRHIIPVTQDNNIVYTFTLGISDLYEILVPTCSYRMGTNKIGFGYAIIGKTTFCLNETKKHSMFFFCRKQQATLHSTLVSVQISATNRSGGFGYTNHFVFMLLFSYKAVLKTKFVYSSKTTNMLIGYLVCLTIFCFVTYQYKSECIL